MQFSHLHNHTQFSILQSTTSVKALVDKAVEMKMNAVALTDTGNMMAAFHFEKAANNYNKGIHAARKKADSSDDVYDGGQIRQHKRLT